MAQGVVSFRPARAEDVDAVVPMIDASGPQAFAWVFQTGPSWGASDFLRAVFPTGQGQWGFQHHLVGERDGEVVAAGAAYTGAEAAGFLLTSVRQFLTVCGPLATPGVAARGLCLERILPPPGREVLYLCHLGVVPEARSQGIGWQLVDALVAWRGPERVLELDVALDNPRAEALYRRLGFTQVWDRQSTLRNRWADVPGHRRMRRDPA
ncbi:MAG: GNAT family N-acetyltransferase [Alphaproteobacteria bacterium]|nr:GNAT family N-acetyltransferase [Alphaproteobacteria bacterium]